MYFNMNGGLGCLIVFFIFFLIMSLFGSVLRILFSTPLGIIVLLIMGGYLFYRSRQASNINFEQKSETDYQETSHTEQSFSRDAEDVDFKDIDE